MQKAKCVGVLEINHNFYTGKTAKLKINDPICTTQCHIEWLF